MRVLNKTLIALTFCTLPVACGKKAPEIPASVMDTASFAGFLTEAHLVESCHYVLVMRTHDSSAFDLPEAYGALYEKYHISAEVYDSTLAWYVEHPELLETVYERVAQRLKVLSDEGDKLPPDASDTLEERQSEMVKRLITREDIIESSH